MKLPDGWKYIKLSDITTPLTEMAGDKKYETLSISAGIGFVNQAKKFGKELSGKQYGKYTVLQRGDFSYNKGNSKKYPQGCIYQLTDRDCAAVPNVFESFRFILGINDYYEQLFMSGFLNHQLASKINHGVRDDGLLNLTGKDFYDCFVPFPSLAEQQKIAEILCKQDKIISLKQKLLEQKLQQKKWLMQKLLEISHTNADCEEKISLGGVVIDKSGWKKVKLGNCVDFLDNLRKPVKEKDRKKGCFPYYGASGIIDYVDDYIFDGEFILLGEDGANILFRSTPLAFKVSGKLWINNHAHVMQPKSNFDIDFLSNYLESLNYEKYNTGTAQPKLNQEICETIEVLSPSLPEQKIIAQVLSAADKEIALIKSSIEQEKQKKKSLAQLLLTGTVRVNT